MDLTKEMYRISHAEVSYKLRMGPYILRASWLFDPPLSRERGTRKAPKQIILPERGNLPPGTPPLNNGKTREGCL
jgi:hypothetical protein